MFENIKINHNNKKEVKLQNISGDKDANVCAN